MPIGSIELLFCLFGFIIIPAGVAIGVMMRSEELDWVQRGVEGLKYAAGTALISLIVFVLIAIIARTL